MPLKLHGKTPERQGQLPRIQRKSKLRNAGQGLIGRTADHRSESQISRGGQEPTLLKRSGPYHPDALKDSHARGLPGEAEANVFASLQKSSLMANPYLFSTLKPAHQEVGATPHQHLHAGAVHSAQNLFAPSLPDATTLQLYASAQQSKATTNFRSTSPTAQPHQSQY